MKGGRLFHVSYKKATRRDDSQRRPCLGRIADELKPSTYEMPDLGGVRLLRRRRVRIDHRHNKGIGNGEVRRAQHGEDGLIDHLCGHDSMNGW